MDVEECIRTRFTFDGENFYLITGETFVDVTCPRENSPERRNIQAAMDAICRVISEQRMEAKRVSDQLAAQLHKSEMLRQAEVADGGEE